jgi:hypothetical protein
VNSEKQKLIQELLDDQSANRRQATLLAGRQIFRRRRWRRAAYRGAWIVAAILAITTVVVRNTARQSPPVAAIPTPAPEPVLKSLTDAELLALFPDTAVGIITLEDGRKRLIFPRPGDEARFIKRM